MDGMNIQNIGPAKAVEKLAQTAKTDQTAGSTFKDMLTNSIREINEVNVKADQAIEKIAQGEVQDVHQVMLAVEKANLTFTTMMQIRNKLLDAYKEVMQMRF